MPMPAEDLTKMMNELFPDERERSHAEPLAEESN